MSRKKYTDEELKVRQRDARKRHYAKNREQELLKNKLYRQTPYAKEKHRIDMIEYRKKNTDLCRAIANKCREKNKERINKEQRDKYKNDPIHKSKKIELEAKYKASGRRAEMHRRRYLEKSEDLREISRVYQKNNKDKIRVRMQEYRSKKWNAIDKKQRDDLADQYVISRIKDISKYTINTVEIPKDLIELKRAQMQLKRELKKQIQ